MLWELVKRRSNRQKNVEKITPREPRQCHVECYSSSRWRPRGAAALRESGIFCAWLQVQRPRKIIEQTITASAPTSIRSSSGVCTLAALRSPGIYTGTPHLQPLLLLCRAAKTSTASRQDLLTFHTPLQTHILWQKILAKNMTLKLHLK